MTETSPAEGGWRREGRQGLGRLIRAGVLLAVLGGQLVFALAGTAPPWRAGWFDLLQRSYPREALTAAGQSPVRIVAVQPTEDRISDRQQWSRDRIAELIFTLRSSGAEVVGLDIDLDGYGVHELAEMNANNAVGIVTGPEGTEVLAETLAGTPVVTPVSLFSSESLRPPYTRRIGAIDAGAPARSAAAGRSLALAQELIGDAPLATRALRAHPRLVSAAAAEGLVVRQYASDSITRRLSLVEMGEEDSGAIRPWFAMAVEMLRLAAGQEHVSIGPAPTADAEIRIGPGIALPVTRTGEMWLKLRPYSPLIYRPAEQVISAPPDAAFFGGTMVVIARSWGISAFGAAEGAGDAAPRQGDYLGLVDTALFETRMGAELIAQTIEQAVSGDYLVRPGWAPWTEIAASAVLGLLLITVFPVSRASVAVPLALILVIAFLPAAALAYAWSGLMLDGAGVALAGFAVGSVAFASTLIERDRQHQSVQRALWVEKADRARLEGELDVARRIQMSLLPEGTGTPVAGLEIACHMAPARIVGGDFYDYVVRPDGRLFAVIADVSDKGVPASLFMALSKSQWKSAALRRRDLGEVQVLANREISRDNADGMFVTGVACLYDPETGRLGYSGAGHEMPVLARPGCAAVTLPEASGPPLGVGPAARYATAEVALAPGDLVCLYTDGLSEALVTHDPNGAPRPGEGLTFFGAEGVTLAIEAAADARESADAAMTRLLALLHTVTDGAEQTDDRTVVILRALPAEQSEP